MESKLALAAIAVVVLGAATPAFAQERRSPAAVQDPPGTNAVDQPAAITIRDRDTPRDTTDPMHAGPYADMRPTGRTPAERQPGTKASGASEEHDDRRGTANPVHGR
jgi:hypothetical protein